MGDETGEVLVDALVRGEGEALVPLRLAQELVTRGHGAVERLGLVVLLDFGVVVLGVPAVLIERGGLHARLDGGEAGCCGRTVAGSHPARSGGGGEGGLMS